MLSLIVDLRECECAVYAPCKYACVGIYKCFRATAGIVHWKRRGEGGVTSRRVGSKKTGAEEGNRQRASEILQALKQ